MAVHKSLNRPDECDGCALVARRDFLRDATVMAAAALVGLGATPALAAAAPIDFVSPIGGERQEKTYPIPAADGTQIDKGNDAIITRWQDKVYAFALACPHQNTALKWSAKNNQFECPKHHSRFTPDGIYIKDSGRATRGLDRLAIRKDGNTVIVDLDKAFQEDESEAAWRAAFVTV
jgi:Rieske Fe-S protein